MTKKTTKPTPKNELTPYYENIKKQLLQFLAEDTLALTYYQSKDIVDENLLTRIETNKELLKLLNELL
jgi:maleate cis-trans isomerase